MSASEVDVVDMDIDFGEDLTKPEKAAVEGAETPVEVGKPKKKKSQARKKTTTTTRGAKGAKGRGRGRPRKGVPKKAGKKAVKGTGGIKRPHRWRAGTVALREIRHFQKTNDLQFRKLPFSRLVREIMQDIQLDPTSGIGRIGGDALLALQEAAEAYVVELFEATNNVTVSAKRKTILPRDMALVQKVQMPGLPRKY